MRSSLAVAAVAAGFISIPALAQTTVAPGAAVETTSPGVTLTPVAPMGTAPASGIDMTIGVLQNLDARDFFREAASSDVFEQESSQMALDKSSR